MTIKSKIITLVLIPTYGEEIPTVLVDGVNYYYHSNATYTSENLRQTGFETYHLGFLSDDPIKKHDLTVSLVAYPKIKARIKKVENTIYKFTDDTIGVYDKTQLKKLIGSTNKNLKLPYPSDSFMKKFCNLKGNIKQVIVIHDDEFPQKGKDGKLIIKPLKEFWNKDEIKKLFIKLEQSNLSINNIDNWIDDFLYISL